MTLHISLCVEPLGIGDVHLVDQPLNFLRDLPLVDQGGVAQSSQTSNPLSALDQV